jgi:tRNA-specific 2-thiouridylase
MRLGGNPPRAHKRSRCGTKEIDDAHRVCRALGIEHYVLDLSGLLRQCVIDNFVAEYAAGRTPNPCVQCNRYLKFGALLRAAHALGFKYLATGHYAVTGAYKRQTVIKKPKDILKDQTYFLYGIPRRALPGIMFPLGRYTKNDVRQIAREAGLPAAEKPQSQDICFIPDKDYAAFLAAHGYRSRPGDIADVHGTVLGRHKGVINYTIGQRGGLGISSPHGLYVRDIVAAQNRIVVCERKELAAAGLIAGQINLHVRSLPRNVGVKIRYGHAAVPASVSRHRTGIRVMFKKAQESVTPGQSAVLYDRDVLLGGGIIERVLRRKDEH